MPLAGMRGVVWFRYFCFVVIPLLSNHFVHFLCEILRFCAHCLLVVGKFVNVSILHSWLKAVCWEDLYLSLFVFTIFFFCWCSWDFKISTDLRSIHFLVTAAVFWKPIIFFCALLNGSISLTYFSSFVLIKD